MHNSHSWNHSDCFEGKWGHLEKTVIQEFVCRKCGEKRQLPDGVEPQDGQCTGKHKERPVFPMPKPKPKEPVRR